MQYSIACTNPTFTRSHIWPKKKFHTYLQALIAAFVGSCPCWSAPIPASMKRAWVMPSICAFATFWRIDGGMSASKQYVCPFTFRRARPCACAHLDAKAFISSSIPWKTRPKVLKSKTQKFNFQNWKSWICTTWGPNFEVTAFRACIGAYLACMCTFLWVV